MSWRSRWEEFWAGRSSKAGVIFLAVLIAVSLYVVATYPLDFGLRIWNNPSHWADNPKAVPPAWTAYLTDRRVLPHLVAELRKPSAVKPIGGGLKSTYSFEINYIYDDFPSLLSITIGQVTYWSRPPVIDVYLDRPDGSLRLLRVTVPPPRPGENPPYRRNVETSLRVILSGEKSAMSAFAKFFEEKYGVSLTLGEIGYVGLESAAFGVPSTEERFKVLKGDYRLRAVALLHDKRDRIEFVRFVVGGRVYGLMGTDTIGRDLAVGLLFGFPVALLIGVLTSSLTTLIGATAGIVSGYVGGKVDTGIQRLSDIILNIPLLPILIFFTFILGAGAPRLMIIMVVLIAFSWPGLTIVVRPMILQIRESQLIEAAVSLGAPRWWIMFRHIFPQVAPFIFAQLIFFTPSAILAEAALSFLGLGDPSIPTWGQILEYGFRNGAVYLGYWWWVLPPGLLIMVSAITFVLIALGLEPVVNPRLRRFR